MSTFLISFLASIMISVIETCKVVIIIKESGDLVSAIGKRIISLRENKKWTQRELARRIDLNFSVMNRIESGDRPIRDAELRDLADVFGVSTDYILGRTDNKTEPVDEKNAIDEEIRKLQKEMQVWYADEPKDKKIKLQMLQIMLKSFQDDEK